MDKFEPPSSMSFNGNVAENWDVWKQELELYLVATEKDEKSDKIKAKHQYYFTVLVSREERLIIPLHGLPLMTDQKFETVLEKFDNYCPPLKNLIYLRQIFSYRDMEKALKIL